MTSQREKEMIMRLKPILFGLIFVGMLSEQAFALDNVERAIVKCRTSANSITDQVSCLETALRTLVESKGGTDWTDKEPVSPVVPDSAVVPDPAIGTAPTSVARIEARGIGAEQVPANRESKRAEEVVREQSVVADFAYNQSDRLILVLANGQVWKQRTSDLNSVRLKKGEKPAVIIRPGAVSGYRMEFLEQKKTIVVSRLQ